MGACSCRSNSEVISRAGLQRAIVTAIDSNDIVALEELYERFIQSGSSPYVMPELTLEDHITTCQGMELTPLAYAFKQGKEEIAAFLIEKAGCSVSNLYALYKPWGKTPLYVLCEAGHAMLLLYFLPICKEAYSFKDNSSPPSCSDSYEISLFADKATTRARHPPFTPAPLMLTPAQKACEKGHLDVIKVLWKYSQQNSVFRDISLHYIDDRTGETCSLLAARYGHYHLIRYLFQECRVDFTVKNKRKESALQLALLGAKHHPSARYFECVKYLVETVKVDLMYEYEETLLLVEDKAIQEYLEMRLQALGVSLTKSHVEDAYAIQRSRPPPTASYIAQDEQLCALGTDFRLSEVFHSELNDSSYLSPIPLQADQSAASIPSALI